MSNIFEKLKLKPNGTRGFFIEENLKEIENFLRSKGEAEPTPFEKELVAYINETIKIENNGLKLRKHELLQLFEDIFNSLVEHENVQKLLEKDKKLKRYNLEDEFLKVITDLRSRNYEDKKFYFLKEFRTNLVILFGLYINKVEFAKNFKIKPIRIKEKLEDKIIKTALENPELTQKVIAQKTGAAYGTVKNTMSKYGKGNKKVT